LANFGQIYWRETKCRLRRERNKKNILVHNEAKAENSLSEKNNFFDILEFVKMSDLT
jgi:hypothetical protein